jgi:probable phosphoglycerate mutase
VNQRWPKRLWIVRHGESAGNIARDAAHAAGLLDIDIKDRDVDVPLSDLGRRQSQSLGRWFADFALSDRPNVLLCSPYLRAQDTARLIAAVGGLSENRGIVLDERLREKEFGILDRLTRHGIEQRYPELASARALMDKFYFRPPGGESWCDVILRLRSVLDTVSLHYAGKNVLIVAHQVVVLCMRYLLEAMDERTILAIDAERDVANCAVTEYSFDPESKGSAMQLERYNFIAPMEREGTAVTAEPDRRVATR